MPPHQSPAVTASPKGGSLSGGLPVMLLQPQSGKEGSRPLPTNNRKVGSYRQNARSRQVCRGRIYASRAVFPIYRNIRDGCNGRHICRPYRATKAFPLGGRWRGTRRMRGRCPAVTPSSVTCGDSFPQGGKPFGRFTRNVVITIKPRAGHTPPLPCIVFFASFLSKSLPKTGIVCYNHIK